MSWYREHWTERSLRVVYDSRKVVPGCLFLCIEVSKF